MALGKDGVSQEKGEERERKDMEKEAEGVCGQLFRGLGVTLWYMRTPLMPGRAQSLIATLNILRL